MGTVVRSVAAGRVAFADRQDEYGLTVILDHGDHYYSLYGSLGSSDVHAGDTIAAGARVGTVGSIDGDAAAPLLRDPPQRRHARPRPLARPLAAR